MVARNLVTKFDEEHFSYSQQQVVIENMGSLCARLKEDASQSLRAVARSGQRSVSEK